VIRCADRPALSLCKGSKESQCVKHIDTIHNCARDHAASGQLSFVCCKLEENVRDLLTQVLTMPLFEKGLVGPGMIGV
jgi:hypothetical protein